MSRGKKSVKRVCHGFCHVLTEKSVNAVCAVINTPLSRKNSLSTRDRLSLSRVCQSTRPLEGGGMTDIAHRTADHPYRATPMKQRTQTMTTAKADLPFNKNTGVKITSMNNQLELVLGLLKETSARGVTVTEASRDEGLLFIPWSAVWCIEKSEKAERTIAQCRAHYARNGR